MSSEIAIKVENLSKCYQIYDQPRDRLKQFLLPPLRRLAGLSPNQYYRRFWALKDVSFEVKKGETVGIIGRNGSGKSTLLQMICGTLSPTSGITTTHGRIAALLELGSGFNPDFTGRENVYMNASILGLSRDEIDARFDEIAAFADIGEFIERSVKTYSSGMMVRLAFAVQAQVEPNILIVDEALAVGDAKFQARCFERLKQLKEGGTSILLVTHSTEQIVTHCSRAVLLDHGEVIEAGDSKRVVNRYLDLLFGNARKQIDEQKAGGAQSLLKHPPAGYLNFDADVFSTRPGYNALEYRWGDGAARITDFYLASEGEAYPTAINTGKQIILDVAVKFFEALSRPIFGITIKTKEGVTVYGTNTEILDIEKFKSKGAAGEVVLVKINFVCRLAPGDYFISLGVATSQGEEITPHDRRYDSIHFQVRPVTTFFGLVNTDLDIAVEELT
ncbi:MAG: ABC transporter ATP-binding protein [Burkholderiales bacterium]|jgi:lipopolysaccharide transport system ATP-binding protein|nr:ABC transporter ATP-binding protein [Burkholderiales bacterium]